MLITCRCKTDVGVRRKRASVEADYQALRLLVGSGDAHQKKR
jgi:hypothetical protein